MAEAEFPRTYPIQLEPPITAWICQQIGLRSPQILQELLVP